MRRQQQRLESLTRLLTYILGHRPDEFGLVLDDGGWLSIKSLLQVLAEEKGWGFVRRSHLKEVVFFLDPPRFELSGNLIRSLQTGPAALRALESDIPPALLYRAITRKSHSVVFEHGLRPPVGGQLVLTVQPEMALRIGRRRDPKAVLVTIQAQEAAAKGMQFFRYGEELYLTEALPPTYLQIPPLPREKLEKPAAKPSAPEMPRPMPFTPGSVMLDIQGRPLTGRKDKGRKKGPEWKKQARAERRKRRREP
jgi:putative RNA 2'-phosphotransferase